MGAVGGCGQSRGSWPRCPPRAWPSSPEKRPSAALSSRPPPCLPPVSWCILPPRQCWCKTCGRTASGRQDCIHAGCDPQGECDVSDEVAVAQRNELHISALLLVSDVNQRPLRLFPGRGAWTFDLPAPGCWVAGRPTWRVTEACLREGGGERAGRAGVGEAADGAAETGCAFLPKRNACFRVSFRNGTRVSVLPSETERVFSVQDEAFASPTKPNTRPHETQPASRVPAEGSARYRKRLRASR